LKFLKKDHRFVMSGLGMNRIVTAVEDGKEIEYWKYIKMRLSSEYEEKLKMMNQK
jgi:hypothetical protein